MGVAVLAWYVPMVLLSGGWAAYQAATGSYYAYFIQTTSGAGKLLLGLLENTRALVGFLYNGIGLALLPVMYFVGRYFSPPHRGLTARRASCCSGCCPRWPSTSPCTSAIPGTSSRSCPPSASTRPSPPSG